MTSFIIVGICFIFISLVECGRFYVNPSNTAILRDGLGWSTAFTVLEEAIDAINNSTEVSHQIWLIGNKTYYPNTTKRDECFMIPRNVKIYGGFTGSESNLNSRPHIGTVKYTKYHTLSLVILVSNKINRITVIMCSHMTEN